MLEVELLSPELVERAAELFHRDGFVLLEGALTPEQFADAKRGCDREIKRHMAKLDNEGHRGFRRYSFKQRMAHVPEWTQLIDLQTILPILTHIWGGDKFVCAGAGGEFSAPGARSQKLHSDLPDVFNDPWRQTTCQDVPAPFVAVHFLMVDFTEENGAIRIVPGTQRSRQPIPKPSIEPLWMKKSVLCAPASTAIIRDIRCWHGATANRSDEIRPMMDVFYVAPWFRYPGTERTFPRRAYARLSPTARALCRCIVK